MKHLLLLILFFFILDNARGQTFTFLVKNSKNEDPISYAHIQFGNTLFGAVTDKNGYATITIPENQETPIFQISFMGFTSVTRHISEIDSNNVNIIFLDETDIEMPEISIIDLGKSPFEFYLHAIERINQTFYSKKYQGLGSYEERVVEDKEETFRYRMDLVLVSNGFSNAKGKNIYTSNDDTYFLMMRYFHGKQKYSLLNVAEMLDYQFKYDPPRYTHDNNLILFMLPFKSSLERRTFLMSEMEDSKDWYFEDYFSVDNEKFVKISYSKKGLKISFLIGLEDYSIYTIWFETKHFTDDFENDLERYFFGDISARLDYFKISGKSYLKQFEVNLERKVMNEAHLLGEKNVQSVLSFDEFYSKRPIKHDKIDLFFIDRFYK